MYVSWFLPPDAADISYLIGSDVEEIRRASALFLLKMKGISQVAVDDIVHNCKGLFSQTVDRIQAEVRAKLAESGVDPDTIDGLVSAFSTAIDPFEGIETHHLQEKYFRETLGLIVSYLEIV